MTWLPWNRQNTQFSLHKSPLFFFDGRKFLFFRWNLEPVTPPSQASLILRESRNGKRKSLSFLAILTLLFVASCLICWQIMDHGDVSSESCHWNGFKILCLTGKCLLLCLIHMWNARLLYLLCIYIQNWCAYSKNVEITAVLWTQTVFQPGSGSPERSFHKWAALTVAIHGLREKLTISTWMKDGFARLERTLLNLFAVFQWCHYKNTLCCLLGAHWCFALAPREAWKALGDTSPHQAMQEYIAAVKKLDPSWNPQVGNVEISSGKQTRICLCEADNGSTSHRL